MTREVNQAGVDLIRRFEGCRLDAYPDPGTGGDPWTIGYGATGPGIAPGVVWTQEEAEARLVEDIAQFAGAVDRALTVPVSANEFAAMVSLAFNIGAGAFRKSTLLRLVNDGHFEAAAEQFLRWNRAGGREMPGLTRRRQAERQLFLTPGDE
jgi:lysozyme